MRVVDEAERGVGDLVIDRLHALLRERASVLDALRAVRGDRRGPLGTRVGSLSLGKRRYVIRTEPCSGAAAAQPAPDLVTLLSPREFEIAVHIASGIGCKQAARRLQISAHTVKVHLGRIYAKLGLHKQTQLAALVAAGFAQKGPCSLDPFRTKCCPPESARSVRAASDPCMRPSHHSR